MQINIDFVKKKKKNVTFGQLFIGSGLKQCVFTEEFITAIRNRNVLS